MTLRTLLEQLAASLLARPQDGTRQERRGKRAENGTPPPGNLPVPPTGALKNPDPTAVPGTRTGASKAMSRPGLRQKTGQRAQSILS